MEMYYHPTKEKRIALSTLLRAGFSLRKIATQLRVHHSTLSRELKRNPPVRSSQRYHPGDAHRRAADSRKQANQRFRKILASSELEEILVRLIRKSKWSPEQCAGWLKTYRPRLYVCAQTIYAWIYTSRRDLLQCLHCLKGKYRRTRQNKLRLETRQRLASKRNISNRPSYVNLRKAYGHWEGDTVHGKGKSGYIATFVERKSGYLLARLTPDASSQSFAQAAKQCFEQVSGSYRKTLTLDSGPEMKLAERRSGGAPLPFRSTKRQCSYREV